MEPSLIVPFRDAAADVIGAMSGLPVTFGPPREKSGTTGFGVVAGFLSVANADYEGVMILAFDERSALAVASAVLAEEVPAVGDDVVDLVGELTNIVVGNAKRAFSETGLVFDMATPVTIRGEQYRLVPFGDKGVFTTVPGEVGGGRFVVETNLRRKPG